MALQTSGAISLNDIHVEAGGGSGTTASINDADIRALIGKSSGVTMSFSEWYGAAASQTEYSMVAPQYYFLLPSGTSTYTVYWNGTAVGTTTSTTLTTGGYTYTRGTLRDTVSDKSGTTYFYEVTRTVA